MRKKVKFDRQKKKVIVDFTMENDIKEGDVVIGHNTQVLHQEYDPAAIRESYKGINARLVNVENQLKQDKLKLDTLIIETPKEEVMKIRKVLEDAKKYEEQDRLKDAIKFNEEQIKQLKDDKLSLEPVMNTIKRK